MTTMPPARRQPATSTRGDTPRLVHLSPEALVEEHLDLVTIIAGRMSVRYPRHIDRADVWAAGAAGLVDAANRFDPTLDVPFRGYAKIRISGAIVDWTRSYDVATRRTRRMDRAIQAARAEFRHAHGREPSDEEVAEVAAIGVAEVIEIAAEVDRATLLSLDVPAGVGDRETLRDALPGRDEEQDPYEQLAGTERLAMLRAAVGQLDDRLRSVVVRHYLQGESMRDIGDRLGVTEARVSQLASEAVCSLRILFERFGFVDVVSDDGPGRRRRSEYRARVAELAWHDILGAAA